MTGSTYFGISELDYKHLCEVRALAQDIQKNLENCNEDRFSYFLSIGTENIYLQLAKSYYTKDGTTTPSETWSFSNEDARLARKIVKEACLVQLHTMQRNFDNVSGKFTFQARIEDFALRSDDAPIVLNVSFADVSAQKCTVSKVTETVTRFVSNCEDTSEVELNGESATVVS